MRRALLAALVLLPWGLAPCALAYEVTEGGLEAGVTPLSLLIQPRADARSRLDALFARQDEAARRAIASVCSGCLTDASGTFDGAAGDAPEFATIAVPRLADASPP